MSAFDTFIQAGGAGINLPKIINQAQVAKENDLLNLGRQKEMDEFDANAPVRAAERSNKIGDFERKSTIMGAKELAAYFDAADQAETPQQRLAVISKTLDFLDNRAENIKARGGNPVDTIAAKSALENYIANPVTGQEELANVMNITKQLAQMDVGDGKENRIQSVKRDAQGKTWGIFNDGSTKDLGIDQGADMVYQKVTETLPNGDIVEQVIGMPRTISVDGSTGFGQPVPVDTGGIDADDFLGGLSPNQVLGRQKPNSPTVVGSATNSAAGAATRAEQLEEGKTNAEVRGEERKVIAKDIAQAAIGRSRYLTQMRELSNAQLNINKALQDATGTTTGLIGALTKGIPGTRSLDLKEILVQSGAFLAFDRLGQMRTEESITGGALGQVSNFEIELLKAAVQSVNQAQTEEQLNRALKILGVRLEQLKYGADVREKFLGGIMDMKGNGAPYEEVEAAWNKGNADAYNSIRKRADYYEHQMARADQNLEVFPKRNQDAEADLLKDPTEERKKSYFLHYGELPEGL